MRSLPRQKHLKKRTYSSTPQVLESFIKDWKLFSDTVPSDTGKIIVQHVVAAEAMVQPKLPSEEGQVPSFIELAERLAKVVS